MLRLVQDLLIFEVLHTVFLVLLWLGEALVVRLRAS